MLFVRGIIAHCAVWLISCMLHPLFWSGLSGDAAIGLLVAPFAFVIALPLLGLGSAAWMAPFLVSGAHRLPAVVYHFWVALGGSVALLCASELGTLGDPRPTTQQYFTGAVVAFPIGLACSMASDRWLRLVQGLTRRCS